MEEPGISILAWLVHDWVDPALETTIKGGITIYELASARKKKEWVLSASATACGPHLCFLVSFVACFLCCLISLTKCYLWTSNVSVVRRGASWIGLSWSKHWPLRMSPKGMSLLMCVWGGILFFSVTVFNLKVGRFMQLSKWRSLVRTRIPGAVSTLAHLSAERPLWGFVGWGGGPTRVLFFLLSLLFMSMWGREEQPLWLPNGP